MTKWDGATHYNMSARVPSLIISSESHSTTECAAKFFDDLNFGQVLESHVTRSLSELNTSSTKGSIKTKAQQPIDYVTLANHWKFPRTVLDKILTKLLREV